MTFTGEVKTKWLNGRDMELLDDFAFTDSKGVVWIAPKGCVINGASIPRFFWRIIGSPYIGYYRYASVIHDYFCQIKERPAKDVHKMFYEACLEAGEVKLRAKLMYITIRLFGPKW